MALHRFPSSPILIMEPGRGRDSDTMDVFATRLPLELIRKIASNCSGSAGAASSENQGQLRPNQPQLTVVQEYEREWQYSSAHNRLR